MELFQYTDIRYVTFEIFVRLIGNRIKKKEKKLCTTIKIYHFHFFFLQIFFFFLER